MLKRIALWVIGSLLVGAAYLAALMISGALTSLLGVRPAGTSQGGEMLPWLIAGSVVIGLVLGPIASQLAATRARHLVIWTCVIFFNLISVLVEGSFFAPEEIGNNAPLLIAQQLLATILMAIVISQWFAKRAPAADMPRRVWYDWAWRFVASALSYLVFYFIFGAVNYALVTKPYYDSHAGGLAVPAPGTVFAAEIVRGVMIALSVLPFLLTLDKPRRERMLWTGLILFVVGGIVPLLYQVTILPLPLLVASGVEIFFQNMSTGIVAALLLERPSPNIRAALSTA